MPDGFFDKLYSIGEGMGGIAGAFVTFSEGKIKSGIGNIMGQKGSFDGFVDLLIQLSQKDINGEQIQKALEGFSNRNGEGRAASQVKDLRSSVTEKSWWVNRKIKKELSRSEQITEIEHFRKRFLGIKYQR